VENALNQHLAPSDVQEAAHRLERVRREVSKVFIGDAAPLDLLLIALMARGHALLEGVPGVAKTTLVKAFASVLGCSMRRIQFTPDLLPQDITGSYVLTPKSGDFALRRGPIFANVVLADEINRAPAKTQSALLEAMQEHQVTIEGDRMDLPDPFLVLATQNPIDLEGTFPLPEAQIDRFLVHVELGYPSQRDEVVMLRAHGVTGPEPQKLLDADSCLGLQSVAARVHIEDDLLEYATALARFTRTHPRVVLGCSPRATLSLVRAAKAHAVLRARPYVTPDDMRAVAKAVLAHRLLLSPELESDPNGRSAIIQEGLNKVSFQRQVQVAQ
jgi:MoxR-like ATPase